MSDATLTHTAQAVHAVQPPPVHKRKKRRQLVKVTPWKDAYEWQLVGHHLRGALDLIRDGRIVRVPSADSTSTLCTRELEEALQLCQVWKVRCSDTLPLAIESSYCLAQLLLSDATTCASPDSIMLQMSYSTAIIRSVNGLADGLQQRRRSAAPVSHLCATLGLPGWIVDMRHEATHNALPSLPQLRLAAHTLLGFFLEKYWQVLTGSRQQLLDVGKKLLQDYIATRQDECARGLNGDMETRTDPTVVASIRCTTGSTSSMAGDDDQDDPDNEDNGDSDQMDEEEDWLANNYFAALVQDRTTTTHKSRRSLAGKEPQTKKRKASEPRNEPELEPQNEPELEPQQEAEPKEDVSSILALHYVKTVPQDVAYHAALSFLIWGDEGSEGLLLSCTMDPIIQPLLEVLCQTWPGFLVAVVTHAVEFRRVHPCPTDDCPLAQWMRRNCDFLRNHSHALNVPGMSLSGRLAQDSPLRQAIEEIYLEGGTAKSAEPGTALPNWSLAENWEPCTIGILPGHVV